MTYSISSTGTSEWDSPIFVGRKLGQSPTYPFADSKHLRHLSTALLLIIVFGCSRDGRLSISGTVNLDGKPLQSGTISFMPPFGSGGHSAGGVIENGSFCIPADHGLTPGKYRVSVEALVPMGKKANSPIGDASVMSMPLLFADRLEAAIENGGENHFDFQLNSADKAR